MSSQRRQCAPRFACYGWETFQLLLPLTVKEDGRLTQVNKNKTWWELTMGTIVSVVSSLEKQYAHSLCL